MKPADAEKPAAAKNGEPKGAGDAEGLAKRLKAVEEERDRLKAEVDRLRAEVADVRDKHLRARADYDNLQKRVAKEAQEAIRAAKGGLLLRYVNDVEVIERAQRDLEGRHPQDAKGLRLVADDLRKLLKDEGVKEIEALGAPFNYKYHQAVEQVETSDKPEGTIVEVVQRGYLVHGEVLRPALVKVAVPPRKPAAAKEASAQQA